MPPYPVTNFVMQKYYQDEPNFMALIQKNNLPKIKGAHVINLYTYGKYRKIKNPKVSYIFKKKTNYF